MKSLQSKQQTRLPIIQVTTSAVITVDLGSKCPVQWRLVHSVDFHKGHVACP